MPNNGGADVIAQQLSHRFHRAIARVVVKFFFLESYFVNAISLS
jgi:hypothetical protein